MRRIDAGLAAALGIACCIGVGGARAAGQSGATPAAKASSAAPASFAGCVQPLATDKTTLVLSGVEERLMEAIRNCPAGSAATISSYILERVDAFTAGADQHDDMTIVIVRLL